MFLLLPFMSFIPFIFQGMLSHPLRLTLCLHSCYGQIQLKSSFSERVSTAPWLRLCQDEPGSVFCSPTPPQGISLTCRAGKGAAPAYRGAELAVVSVVLLIKVLRGCAGCLRAVSNPHLLTSCSSHTRVSEVTPVTRCLSQPSMSSC